MNRAATIRVLALSAALVSAAPAQSLESLDRYFARALRDWKVPGMAVAIVKDGRVVLSRGYGVREAGGSEEVDADTLFAIASNTKAFTAAALAILVDEGRIDWDDRVREHVPCFELRDRYAGEEMRIRDLLCHRSGLGTFSGDLLWYLTNYSREEVIRRARHLKPARSFRSGYGYSNLMFIAAGEIIPAVTGTSWDDFVEQRIFEPLEMKRTVASVMHLEGAANVASPHGDIDGELRVYPWAKWDAMAAAGGIISSANDMSRWMRMQLNEGTLEGRSIYSKDASHVMWTSHISLPVSRQSRQLHPSTHFRGYGLGWALSDYLGRKIVGHGGAYDGMFSRLTLVPEENLGLVILTNATTALQTALTYRVLDHYLGGEEKDWSSFYLERFRRSRQTQRRRREEADAGRVAGTEPSLELEGYTGRFGGDLYGDAEISLEEGRLVLRLLPAPELVGDLEHWHFDVFELTWRRKFPWFGKGKVRFILDNTGAVEEFRMDVPNEDFWFDELEFKKRTVRTP